MLVFSFGRCVDSVLAITQSSQFLVPCGLARIQSFERVIPWGGLGWYPEDWRARQSSFWYRVNSVLK